jgi:hypothetical protein
MIATDESDLKTRLFYIPEVPEEPLLANDFDLASEAKNEITITMAPILRLCAFAGLHNSLRGPIPAIARYHTIAVILLAFVLPPTVLMLTDVAPRDLTDLHNTSVGRLVFITTDAALFLNIMVYLAAVYFVGSNDCLLSAFRMLFEPKHQELLRAARNQFSKSVRSLFVPLLACWISFSMFIVIGTFVYVVSTGNSGREFWIGLLTAALCGYSVACFGVAFGILLVSLDSMRLAIQALTSFIVDPDTYQHLIEPIQNYLSRSCVCEGKQSPTTEAAADACESHDILHYVLQVIRRNRQHLTHFGNESFYLSASVLFVSFFCAMAYLASFVTLNASADPRVRNDPNFTVFFCHSLFPFQFIQLINFCFPNNLSGVSAQFLSSGIVVLSAAVGHVADRLSRLSQRSTVRASTDRRLTQGRDEATIRGQICASDAVDSDHID